MDTESTEEFLKLDEEMQKTLQELEARGDNLIDVFEEFSSNRVNSMSSSLLLMTVSMILLFFYTLADRCIGISQKYKNTRQKYETY